MTSASATKRAPPPSAYMLRLAAIPDNSNTQNANPKQSKVAIVIKIIWNPRIDMIL